MLQQINNTIAQLTIFMIKIYQRTLSPDKGVPSIRLRGRICHHTPHCSEYGIQVLKKYGFYPGIKYMIDRITSCTGATKTTHDPASYKVVFCSSAPIGITFLKKIIADPRYDLIGVVTTPDKPSGRGMKTKPNSIKVEASKTELDDEDIKTPSSLRLDSKKHAAEAQEFTQRIQTKQPDFLVVIAYGKIIPQHILNIPKVAPINVHGSILPHYRGASPIQSVFLNNEKQSGITIMKMDAGLDTGDILTTKKTKLHHDWTARDLINRMQDNGPPFLNDTMRNFAKGHIDPQPQDNQTATHCTKLEKKHGHIDPYNDTLEKIYNTYRGCVLRPKAHFFLSDNQPPHAGKRIIIEQLRIDQNIYNQNKNKPLLQKDNTKTTINKAITILLVKPQGKKTMTRDEFQQGYMANS